jgi:SAM-dependent methyltransferase
MNDLQGEHEIKQLTAKTIDDFGEQWSNYKENPGLYGSRDLLPDLFGPLLSLDEIKDATVAEIGSGTGRIINMLLDAGVKHALAIEPATGAFLVLKENTEQRKEKISYLQKQGDEIPENEQLDFIFSIGVIHHIPDPVPVMNAAYKALKPGGKMLVWVYGHEGNELYLSVAEPLRKITKILPHTLLVVLTWILSIFLDLYIAFCRFIPLPMHTYMRNVLAKWTPSVRRMTIYDQLNPAYAKYYKKEEAEKLFTESGFKDVQSFHRHEYSWSVVGTK